MKLPSTLTREEVHRLLPAEQAEKGVALGLPHLAGCIASIERCQASRPGGTVRAYLRQLLQDGWFIITSPETGQELRSGSSLLLVDKSVVFSFPSEPGLLLTIGDLSLGYPICGLLLTESGVFLSVVDSIWGFSERQLPWLKTAIQESGWRPGPAAGLPVLVIGDTNFAHHAWNQLSALHELIEDDLPRGLRMIATQQPLGPIPELFPELSNWRMSAVPDTLLTQQNHIGGMFVPVGGRLITAALAERIRKYSAERMSVPAKSIEHALASAQGPVLWLSVRTRNRTAVNQHAMLSALGQRFLATSASGLVVIDGYSLSADLDSYPDYQLKEARQVLSSDLQAATELYDLLESLHPGRTYVAVGLSINDTIALAGHATFYFSHHGTVQHKIGWFTATPGVVHCNRALLAAAPAHWVAAQSEVAVPPTYLSPNLVEDAAETAGADAEFGHLLRHENYLIKDIPAVVAAVFFHAFPDLTVSQEPLMSNATLSTIANFPAKSGQEFVVSSRPPLRHLTTKIESLVATGVLYTDFFKFIDTNLHPRSYFEIGTHLGRSVKEFSCSAVCVDPQFMLDQDVLTGRPQTHFYQMPSDQFFLEHNLQDIFRHGPDVCFLDGMHRSEYLLRDFMNTERLCHRRSVIFMHDCLPVNARMALRTHEAGDPSEGHWQHAWTGDVWKIVPLLKAHRPDLRILCLDCAPTGLVAVTNLDASSTVLRDGYAGLKEELRTMDLEEHTFQRLWTNVPVLDSRSLVAHPEDLTLFIDIN